MILLAETTLFKVYRNRASLRCATPAESRNPLLASKRGFAKAQLKLEENALNQARNDCGAETGTK